jgi:hypothetical protein
MTSLLVVLPVQPNHVVWLLEKKRLRGECCVYSESDIHDLSRAAVTDNAIACQPVFTTYLLVSCSSSVVCSADNSPYALTLIHRFYMHVRMTKRSALGGTPSIQVSKERRGSMSFLFGLQPGLLISQERAFCCDDFRTLLSEKTLGAS